MKIAICDDVLKCVEDIKKYLVDNMAIPSQDCDIYQSGEDLLETLEDDYLKYDIIFLDMEMKGIDGIETGKLIREKNEDVVIIFVTSYENYMKQSFECRPFRFLTKPIDYEEMRNTVIDAQKYLAKRKKYYVYHENRAIKKIRFCDITYCESFDHSLIIHTRNGEYRLFKSLKKFCKEADKTSLYRVHNSYVVNFEYVNEIKEKFISLHGVDFEIPIGKVFGKDISKKYTNYFEGSLRI